MGDPSESDALRARLAEAEEQLRGTENVYAIARGDLADAVARAETAEAELAEHKRRCDLTHDKDMNYIREVERDRDTLTEALLVTVDPANRDYPGRWLAAARAALAAVKGTNDARVDTLTEALLSEKAERAFLAASRRYGYKDGIRAALAAVKGREDA